MESAVTEPLGIPLQVIRSHLVDRDGDDQFGGALWFKDLAAGRLRDCLARSARRHKGKEAKAGKKRK